MRLFVKNYFKLIIIIKIIKVNTTIFGHHGFVCDLYLSLTHSFRTSLMSLEMLLWLSLHYQPVKISCHHGNMTQVVIGLNTTQLQKRLIHIVLIVLNSASRCTFRFYELHSNCD